MIKADYPYDNYKIYVVYHKKQKRRYACLVPLDKTSGLKRKTISYARYLMSCNLGRFLLDTEEVDHIDDNKLNDSLENLQILSRAENLKKEAKSRGRKMVLLRCPTCGKEFSKRIGETHLSKGGGATHCSRSCAGKHLDLYDNVIGFYKA